MRKTSLLLLLLMALMAPWAANAQETVEIGDATSTSAQYSLPVNMYYNYSLTQQIYTAEEIGMEGTINSIAFEYTPDISFTMNNVQVYMMNVDKASFESTTDMVQISASDLVWEGTFTATEAGWVTIALDTPFEYDGTSNLLVCCYDPTSGYPGSSCKFRTTATTEYLALAYYSDTYSPSLTDVSTFSGSKYRYQYRANIQLAIVPVATSGCPRPKTLVASNVTAHTATLTWTMDEPLDPTASGFNLEYKKVSDPDDSWNRIGVGPSVLSFDLSGLDPETEYQARVQSACGNDDNSDWRNAQNFTTEVACPAPTGLAVTDITANDATVSWTGTSDSYVVMIGQENCAIYANFENNEIPANFTNDATYPWTVVANTHSGAYCAKSGNGNYHSTTSALQLEVNLTTDMTLTFSAKVSSEGSWDKAYFTIDGTAKIDAISGNGNWIDYSYPLTAGSHTLRWYYTKDSSSNSYDDCFYVDDIVISTGVASWTEYTTNNLSYTFNNLTSNTHYQVKVKGNCGSEGYSAETVPVSFTTDASCAAPTGLHIVEGSLTAHRVTMAWDIEQDVYYQYAMTHGITSDPTNVNWGYEEHILSLPYWTNLYADHDYTFYVRKWCSEEEQSETIFISFHTPEACPAPTDFAVVDNSITGHEATLTWEGTSQSYNVSYRTKAYMDGIEEGFGTSIPSGWEMYTGKLIDGTATMSSSTYGWSFGTSNGVFDNHARVNIYSDYQRWLVMPAVSVPANAGLSFDLALTAYSGTDVPAPQTNGTDDKFMVLISTDNMETWTTLREWDNSGSTYVYNDIANTATGENVSIDLSAYADQSVRIAFYGESTESNADNNLHIDNVAIGTPVAAGEMQYVNNIEEQTVTLSDLLAERKYEAWLIGDCGSDGASTEVGPITFTTGVACPAPTGLVISELTATRVVISWDAEEGEMFQVNMPASQDLYPFDPNNPPTDWNSQEQTANFAAWSPLIPETTYGIWLRKYCNEDEQSEPIYIMFTTLAECPVPTEVTVSDVGHYTATVNWIGNSEEGFKVKYRESVSEDALFKEDFENASSFANWTFISMNTDNNIESGKTGRIADAAHTGSFGFRFSSYNDASDFNQYLVSPELTVTGELKFYFKKYNSSEETLYVGYSTTTNDLDDETAWTWTEDLAPTESWQEYTQELPADVKYIAFHYYGDYTYYVYVDDITIGAYEVPAGDWQFITAANSPADIGGLIFGTKYDVFVVPICDETAESEVVSFTTKSANEKVFAGNTSDDWNEGSNWIPYGVPTFDQTVELRANVTISDEAFANTISQGNYAITIEDGKLKSNTGVNATVKKSIRGYNTNYDPETYNNGDYYLITNPLTITVTPSEDNGFHVGNYDLYNWNYAEDLEWRNNVTSLYPGMYGYLYANETGTTLTYTGSINPYTGYKYRSASVPSSPENYDFPGWYLFGNPYMYDAYLTNASSNGTALPYIKMNANGDGFENVAAGTPIEPMEGFFYQGVTGATSAYVVTYEPTVQSNGKLNINLRSANKQLDNAILMFGGNQQMGKMTFRENSSKVYMPVEGKDYAITTAEGQMGEMPVNFKAEKNGSYTLSFTNEDVDFSYLHLIDNLTGEDVDLLAGASTGSAAYTFNASTTDYESRFKLVFATGTSAEGNSFSFVNASGNLCIFGIEGEATVQVIDILGHVISSETFSGSYERKINGAPGVYMVRLINGNDVKVQKVVVR